MMRRVVFKPRLLWLVTFAMLAGAWPLVAQAAVPPPTTVPPLGAAADYAVLAGTALTCTDSTVTGPVGVNFTPTPTHPTLTGCHMPPAVNASGAYANFGTAYADIAGNLGCPPAADTVHNLSGTLDGAILDPGTYCFDAAAALTGTLTLRGTGQWLFEIGSGATGGALTTNSFTVISDNPCNVFWWVNADVTLNYSAFQGTILGGGDITLTGTSLAGRLWATNAMTMTGSHIFGCNAAGTVPGTTSKCLAAQQALDVAIAKDVIEDASERARDKKEGKHKDDEDKAHGDSHDSKADKREDKAENALMSSLQRAVRKACSSEHDD